MTTPSEEEARTALAQFDQEVNSIGQHHAMKRCVEALRSLLASRVSTPPSEEWEYGCANFGDLDDVITVPGPLALQGETERGWAEGVLQPEYGDLLVRRRRVGSWEPVPAVPVLPTESEDDEGFGFLAGEMNG